MADAVHCAFCFDVIINSFQPRGRPLVPTIAFPPNDAKFPMFVTWMKSDGNGWRLRGCIGTFSAKSLQAGLQEYAYISAFQDGRFSPLKEKEIPSLKCNVSLLTNFEPARDLDDWLVGTHGITIDFKDRGKSYSATYLPEVAEEQGWSREKAISELVAKSGYNKPVTQDLRRSIRLTRYQSSKASLTYTQYQELQANPRAAQRPLQPLVDKQPFEEDDEEQKHEEML